MTHGQPAHAQSIRNKLALVHYDIKESLCKDLDQKEQNAVKKIKSNAKFFYSYAKSLSKVKSSISMLIDNIGNVITDTKSIADNLQNQFTSVFSDPNAAGLRSEPEFPVLPIKSLLQDCDYDLS